MQDVEIIGMLKSYVKTTLVGMGALKGAPCQCVIATNQDGTHTVTMKWVDNEGDEHTDSFTVLNGQVGAVEDISDVQVTSLVNGQVLAWDSTAGKWVNVTNSASVESLANIGDVQFTALADGEVLTWDDTAGKWKNKVIPVDNALSNSSENPVQNKVVFAALEDKADKATTLSGYGITDAYTKTETDSAISTGIGKLDVSDSATAGSYVTAVSETDGKISVTKEAADDTPTASSNKMVKSGGVYTDISNEAKTRGAMGAKNLMPFDLSVMKELNTSGTWTDNVYSFRGVDFTVNADGTITADGTATGGNASLKIYAASSSYEMLGKTVIMNGCPSGGGATSYRIQAYRMGSADGLSGTYFDDGEGTIAFEALNNASGTIGSFAVAVYENTEVNDLVFAPMVRLATDIDPTHQQYAKTNKQLTDEQGYFTDDQWAQVTALLT